MRSPRARTVIEKLLLVVSVLALLTTLAFTITILVAPSFDFSLGATPASGSVALGGSVSTNITATSVSGSTQEIQYSCANLPSGTSCAFQPSSCRPTCNTVLSIAASASASTGTYPVSVQASTGSRLRNVTFSLTIAYPARVLTFQEGDGGAYSATDDSFIHSGFPSTNYGTNTTLAIDGDGCLNRTQPSYVCKTLIRFPRFLGSNEGQIPPGSTIVSATLQLNVTKAGPTEDFHKLMDPWNESTVTWNAFSIPGQPRTGNVNGTFTPTPIGRLSLTLTALVQRWVDGDPNEGILLASSNGTRVEYDSSESAHQGDRPRLTVTVRPSLSAPLVAIEFSIRFDGPERLGTPSPYPSLDLQFFQGFSISASPQSSPAPPRSPRSPGRSAS